MPHAPQFARPDRPARPVLAPSRRPRRLRLAHRRRRPWPPVMALVALVLLLPPLQRVLDGLNVVVALLAAATSAGTSFVFGYLGGAPLPFRRDRTRRSSFVLAFRALPLVLLVSAFRRCCSTGASCRWSCARSPGCSSARWASAAPSGVSAAANVFVGMIEAPLVVRPYLARLSRSELFIVMNCGMATIAGTVLVLYAQVLAPVVPQALGHLLLASFAATPVAIALAVAAGAGPRAPPRRASNCRARTPTADRCAHARHARRTAAAAQHRRDAAGVRRARRARQPAARRPSRSAARR